MLGMCLGVYELLGGIHVGSLLGGLGAPSTVGAWHWVQQDPQHAASVGLGTPNDGVTSPTALPCVGWTEQKE